MPEKPEPNAFYLNPTHVMMQYEEKCHKEMKYYKNWQNQDHIATGGYLGRKYKINDPKTKPYITDKVNWVTPTQPFRK